MIYSLFGLIVVINTIVIVGFYLAVTRRIITYEDTYRRERETMEQLIAEFNRIAERHIDDLEEAKQEIRQLSASARVPVPARAPVTGTPPETRKARLDRSQVTAVIRGLKEKGMSDDEISSRLGLSVQEIELLNDGPELSRPTVPAGAITN